MIQPQDSDIIMYQTVDGLTKIDVQMSTETVWLTREQMAELFQRDRSVIGRHISKHFNNGEYEKNQYGQNLPILRKMVKPIRWITIICMSLFLSDIR